MTPWQFKCCVRAAEKHREDTHNDSVWVMWHHAALLRQKQLPKLDKLLRKPADKKAVPPIDQNAIMARFKAYQFDRDKDKKGKA